MRATRELLLRTSCALLLLVGAAGCASVAIEETQSVTLETVDASGTVVSGAECTLANDRGSWPLRTPGFVVVPRSPKDLQVHCEATGHPPGEVRAVSRVNSPMFLNAFLGVAASTGYVAVAAAAIDYWRGNAFDYPRSIRVVLGESRVADPLEETR
jgi:hypothetical protein